MCRFSDWLRTVSCGICHQLSGSESIIIPTGTMDLNLMSSILLDKLDEMHDSKAAIHLPDKDCKIYDKDEVQAFLNLDEIDKIPYISSERDCDDFAAELFGKFAGLVWTNVHALNWFIDSNETFWFVEPQQDKIAKNLENWEGYDIKFFIGR